MSPTHDQRGRGSLVAVALLGGAALATIVVLVARGVDPLPIFWALTAGLPLIAFMIIIVVVLARRLAPSADQPDDE